MNDKLDEARKYAIYLRRQGRGVSHLGEKLIVLDDELERLSQVTKVLTGEAKRLALWTLNTAAADAAAYNPARLHGLQEVIKFIEGIEELPCVSLGTCTDCKKQDGPCWCGDALGCTC